MIQDLSLDVKKFLLSYTSIHQLIELSQGELNRINGLLEAEILRQDWFSAADFETQRSFRWLQVWKKNWHPSITQGCPWIHFEYTLSWNNQWIQSSVDIESMKIASKEVIQDVAHQLHQALSTAKPTLLKGQGWNLKYPLEDKRMLLIKRYNIDKNELSAEWIFNTGKESFNELSEFVPYIDKTVQELFGK